MSRRSLSAAVYANEHNTEDGLTPLPYPVMANNPAGGGLPSPMTVPATPDIDTHAPMPAPPIPTAPYPYQQPPSPIPTAPATWLTTRPWLLPVGGGLVAFLVGLSVGVAIGRGRRG